MINKYLFSACLCLVVCTFTSAQYLHTPSDFDKVLEKSTSRYTIDASLKAAPKVDRPLVAKGWSAVLTADGARLVAPDIRTEVSATKYRIKGDNFYEKGKFLKAASNYEKMMPTGKSDGDLLKRLADSYHKGGDLDKAIQWYNEAVDVNFIDFEAHQLLAACYREKSDLNKAVRHITLAHLLNRNDPAILEVLKNYYEADGRHFVDYSFEPAYQLGQLNKAEIKLSYAGKPWEAYGKCKAVWKHEVKHREKMSRMSNAPIDEVEEKECLLNAIIVYGRLDATEQQAYPELKSLGFAIAKQNINDYILYEMKAVQEPLLISRLSRQKLLELAEFVKQLRTQ
ncbi:MAG: hypothetical protein AAF990_19870 [Bacteroidota bacterium]